MMQLVRIYSDQNGDSHFQDIQVPLTDAGMVGRLSKEIIVKSLVFREVKPTYDWEFHCAPERQYIVLLDGEIEIETSLGHKRRFRGGDVLLAEDTRGKGHRTKNIHPVARRSLFITLP